MSKLQEIPHLETCPRSFSFNIPYKDKVLLFSLRRNRVSQKKHKKTKIFNFTGNHDSNQGLPIQYFIPRLFFSWKAIKVEIWGVVPFLFVNWLSFWFSGSPGRIIFIFKNDNLFGTLWEKRFFRILSWKLAFASNNLASIRLLMLLWSKWFWKKYTSFLSQIIERRKSI